MKWTGTIFPPGLEPKPKVLTADLCSACNAPCWAGGGEEFCIGHCEHDPAVMMGGEIGRTVRHGRRRGR
jgi:hypothetical protein